MTVDTEKRDFKKQLDQVGCGFCLAKWEQVTIHLQLGVTHSCHHPFSHNIQLSDIVGNPSGLHNTHHKKLQRKTMLEGGRPEECQYCWNIEDSDPNNISDRVHKSYDISPENYEKIRNLDWDANYNPDYVELAFNSQCNFKCAYCYPMISSSIYNEVQEHGSIPFRNSPYVHYEVGDNKPLPENNNIYIETFWKWFPDLIKTLKVLRITGGEPLLSTNTFKVMDYICANEYDQLTFAINSNLNPPENVWEKTIKYMDKLQAAHGKSFKEFQFFTSLEGTGKQAEYVRFGLDYQRTIDRIEQLISNYDFFNVTVMSTYNIFSLSTYDKFLEEIIRLKNSYEHQWRVILNIPYLRYPDWQSVDILPKDFVLPYLENQKMIMVDSGVFDESEMRGINNLISFVENNNMSSNDRRLKISMMYDYFTEYDKRRGTNFCETYPELEEFYKLGANL